MFGLPSTATDVPVLIQVRGLVDRGLIAFMWFMTAVNGVVAVCNGMSVWAAVGIPGTSALVATAAGIMAPNQLPGRLTVAVCLMNVYDMFIYVNSYTSFQIDAHMLYFVLAALLLGYFCWITLLVACVHTALHHTTLNLVLPYLVYPDGESWVRTFYHAAAVLLQLAGTGFIAVRLHRMFHDSEAARQCLAQASAEADALRQAQDAERLRLQAEARETTLRLADAFERQMSGSIAQVASAAAALQATARGMSGAAEQAFRQASSVRDHGRQANANVHAVACSAEELVASVNDISSRVQQSAAIATRAADRARGTNATVRTLSDTALRIGEVVHIIDDIAAQTNLLALNATI
ncbi:MAG TPA: hypothetical protein VE690_17625, partial [Rhodopila sp.]|nr:hypothetical protein [Rhodopila sp.]